LSNRPANILLSSTGIPTFVDFGFSERYDLDSPTSSSPAFRSSLAYGTPEYLSPERARGLTHDPRKSDIWSLGVTFFEIMTGRTPFEHEHGEQFMSKEELEVYWSRTMKGLWVGKEEGWKKFMSLELESLLRKMLEPNADVRITAEEVMRDSYWTSSACSSTFVFRGAH
jgi:serine/threonine-protein kinase GIN4